MEVQKIVGYGKELNFKLLFRFPEDSKLQVLLLAMNNSRVSSLSKVSVTSIRLNPNLCSAIYYCLLTNPKQYFLIVL